MEDRERTVWVFVHLNGHLDKMPAMALLRDLQHPSLVAHGVVIADDALMANAQDLAQRAKERHEGAPLFGRGDRQAAIVLWDVDLPQILVGRRVVTPCSRNSGGSRCCKVPNTRSMRPRASGL